MGRTEFYFELKSLVLDKFKTIRNCDVIISEDNGQYFTATNGKRFVRFNVGKDDSDDPIFLAIREDGDTRYVFNGEVKTLLDFVSIWDLTFPGH